MSNGRVEEDLAKDIRREDVCTKEWNSINRAEDVKHRYEVMSVWRKAVDADMNI
jgi:hypothetical protein